MLRQVEKFLLDEAGAATIDLVALTAGIIVLGIAVVFSIFANGASHAVAGINTSLKVTEVGLCEELEGPDSDISCDFLD